MSTLYEITGDYLRLLEMLEEDESIDEQAFKDTLEGIDGEFEIKAEGYAKVIKELNAEAEKFKAEIERMTAKMNAVANNSARLKQHLYNSMKATGKTKFKTDLFSFGIRGNGGLQPMEITDEQNIPKRYMKMIPDKDKIRKELEAGRELHFAVLKERGEHLSIR
ncbi:MAG: siphovirus Gp157 family protein [Lachnospiraceae bacterium]|nr:siphovirus Gp157 family protein [Lachnospiraceae bacterium]